MIELRDVRKVYARGGRERAALDGVSARFERGGMHAIIGPSGSGKSTLLHLAAGLDLPTSGEVWIDGQRTVDASDDELALLRRRRIGFVFQFFHLIPTLDVLENVALPLLLDGHSRRELRPRVEALLERVGLGGQADRLADELSGGEMQRVAVARALVTEPLVVAADEPTGNLDSAAGGAVLALLAEIAASGRTVLLATHDPAAAARADRVLHLRDGRIDARPA